jgi:hypothetical protein
MSAARMSASVMDTSPTCVVKTSLEPLTWPGAAGIKTTNRIRKDGLNEHPALEHLKSCTRCSGAQDVSKTIDGAELTAA